MEWGTFLSGLDIVGSVSLLRIPSGLLRRHPESLDLLKIDLDSFDCDVISSVLRVGPLASNPPKLLYIDFNPHIPPPFLYRTISRSQSRIIPFQGRVFRSGGFQERVGAGSSGATCCATGCFRSRKDIHDDKSSFDVRFFTSLPRLVSCP